MSTLNRRQLLYAALIPILANYTWSASGRRFAVLHPELASPEREIFTAIRESIRSSITQGGGTVVEQAVSATTSSADIRSNIDSNNVEAVIPLGRNATTLTIQSAVSIPIIAGATELPVPSPSNIGGISLVVSPDRVLSTLIEVAPRIRRVSIVLSSERFGWLRPHIERAARDRSLTVTIYEARAVGEAASHYLNILRYGNPQTDSLWLLEHGQFVTPDTLPHIIEDAWASRFVVFSSVLAHASEGSLFAFYLNPLSLGTRLARLSLDARGRTPALVLDQAPLRAINARTAHHLAGVVDESRIHNFDLILGDG